MPRDDPGLQVRVFGTQPVSLPGILLVLREDQESGNLSSTSTADLLHDPGGGCPCPPESPQS